MIRTLLPVRLFWHVSRRRRLQFVLLLGLTFVSSIAEMISLGAVVPFIGVLTQPAKIFTIRAVASGARMLGVTTAAGLVVPLSIAFAVAAVVAGALRLLLLWAGIRLGNATGADLSIEAYRRTLYQPYRVHVARSSSEIISGITQKVSTATNVLVSLVAVITSVILFCAIIGTLLAIDPTIATISFVSFGIAYGCMAIQTRQRLRRNGECIAREQTQVVKALQEGLGAIRDVLLDGTQGVYSNVYRKAVVQLERANGENAYINQAPRYVTETLGIALVAALAVVLAKRPGGIGAGLPILGALALGAQRLLPLMQQLYGNWSVVAGSRASLVDVLSLLDQPLPASATSGQEIAPLDFRESIQFDNVGFRYSMDGPAVLHGLNFTIKKGSRVGFVGRTGSGKSTALDLLMSLLDPTEGRVLVDGQPVDEALRASWQRAVAHVPQSIYLADASIAENIAFGIPPEAVDIGRVKQAARDAQIAEFIESRPEGYSARVGERGVRLSGGQRQRIGIARALYKQASVLIFDEATSALDSATETAVMKALQRLSRDVTVLIIAHRLTTLQHCDTILRLEGGALVAESSYMELMRDHRLVHDLANA